MSTGNQNVILHRSVPRLLKVIFGFILEDSLDKIDDTLKTVKIEQCTHILNATVNGHTPLSFSIKHNRVEISNFILEHCLRQGRHRMCDFWKNSRHPLTVAMLGNNLNMVRMIAQNIDDINDDFDGPYTPVMLAVLRGNLEFVKIMIRLGADINRPCFNGGSPLMSAALSSEVCRFLVAQGAVINHQDKDCFTALHVAIAAQEMDSLKILVNAGADVQLKSNEGLTPLMYAATEMNHPAVIFLSKHKDYSELERIEALEVLGACLVCAQMPMLALWRCALECRVDRFAKTILPLNKIYDFSLEFSSEADLEELQNRPLDLVVQALLVTERILGINNRVYLRIILQTALIAKRGQDQRKFQQLMNYIEDNYQSIRPIYIATCSGHFLSLFTAIATNPDYKTEAFQLYKLIAETTEEMWLFLEDQYSRNPRIEDGHYSNVVNTFLTMTSMIKAMNLPPEWLERYRCVVVKLIKTDPRVVNNQSLLHCAMKMYKIQPEDLLSLIRVLLETGDIVNSKDQFCRTPLMYALKHAPPGILNAIVDLLIEYGAIVTHEDAEGRSAIDNPRWTSEYISRENQQLHNPE